MKYTLKRIAAGITGGALLVGTLAEGEQLHAEYQGVTPNVNVEILSGGITSNSTASMVISYTPVAFNLESLIPHDHLVMQIASLVPFSEDTALDHRALKVQKPVAIPFFSQRLHVVPAKSDSPRIALRRNFHARRIVGRGK